MTITHGVLNLAQVTEGLWRGGQPTSEGWAHLKSLGVTKIVKLNLEHRLDSDSGLQVVECGIDFADQFDGPVDRGTVQEALSAIEPGTFIHCEHGQDRTGLIVACYRYGTGCTKEQAEAEMLALGFHKILMGLWAFWKGYEL